MNKVRDLRSALELLENMPGQLIETDVEVDPMAELSGVYRHVGAGGTVQRPTKEGPAMIFNNVKGHKDARVLIGLLASRKRVAALLGTEPEDLGKLLYRSVDNPIPPVLTDKTPLCQEVVHRATDEDFDLYKLVPAPTNTPDDAGPYITMGMCYATHPDTGLSDVTIHRMCIQSKDELVSLDCRLLSYQESQTVLETHHQTCHTQHHPITVGDKQKSNQLTVFPLSHPQRPTTDCFLQVHSQNTKHN